MMVCLSVMCCFICLLPVLFCACLGGCCVAGMSCCKKTKTRISPSVTPSDHYPPAYDSVPDAIPLGGSFAQPVQGERVEQIERTGLLDSSKQV